MNQQINLRHIVLTFILAAMSVAASAQHVVKGTVSDGKDPLIGASVYVKDGKAQSGAITDHSAKQEVYLDFLLCGIPRQGCRGR